MKHVYIITTLVISISASLYFGIQGLLLLKYQEEFMEIKAVGENANFSDSTKIVTYNDFIFPNQAEFELHLKKVALERFTLWKSANGYPAYFLLIVTSCSFSLLGANVLMVRKLLAKAPLTPKESILYVILGIMTGIIILGIADIVPTILVEHSGPDGKIRPVTLVFLSFFGGLYINRFYSWADSRFSVIFKSEENEK